MLDNQKDWTGPVGNPAGFVSFGHCLILGLILASLAFS
jgi:hypothetical protein